MLVEFALENLAGGVLRKFLEDDEEFQLWASLASVSLTKKTRREAGLFHLLELSSGGPTISVPARSVRYNYIVRSADVSAVPVLNPPEPFSPFRFTP